MAAILAAAYEDLRAYAVLNWTRVGLYDGAGALSLVLAPGDPRAVWSGAGNPRTLTVSLTAVDADTTGKTFARIKVFKAGDVARATPLLDELIAVAGVPSAVTLVGADTLTVTHTVELPDIA